MFDRVPIRIWLLVMIGAAAFGPARYVYRHVTHSPSRYYVNRPPEDLSWRTSNKLYRNLAILICFVWLAQFIFTPAAADFARSPSFWPLLMAAAGAMAFYSVFRGLQAGKIEPFSRGSLGTYTRSEQPKRFWLSLVWNALFGCFFLWMAFQQNEDGAWLTAQAQCLDEDVAGSINQQLAACNQLIANPSSDDNLADLMAWRAGIYEKLENYSFAIADFNSAISLNPRNADWYLGRGFVYRKLDNPRQAISDYSAAIEINPALAEAFYYRAWAYKDLGDEERAESDFAKTRQLNPELVKTYYGVK